MTTTTWCQCMRIERTDGTVYGLTTLDKSIVFGGVTYSAPIGYDDLDLESTAVLSVNNSNFEGFISGDGVTKADLVGGLWDFAEVQVFFLDYVGGTKVRDLFIGKLGEIEFTDNMYKAELRSLSQYLQQSIGRVFGNECDAVLGDARCGVSLAAFTTAGAITGVTSNKVMIDTGFIGSQSDDYYNYGLLTFTSGNNSGDGREVKDYDDATGTFTTFLEFPFAIESGDTFTVYKGCDKTTTKCKEFSNIESFRGFPFISGRDSILRGGG